MDWLHGLVDPFVAALVDIALSAERAFVDLALGTLVDQGTSDAGKWQGGRVVFEEILTHFRAYGFEKEAQIADNGVVATDGMPGCRRSRIPVTLRAAKTRAASSHQALVARPRTRKVREIGREACRESLCQYV